ncbi:lambda-exonuclease family protein [Pseudoxanthomonas dokdonensis]|uniref:YqaJ viral recombinase domain-containing protein n=1 Tax=Pseudoxanthomonas dokdonensis TaxID=344882 RepID=A0A0R0CI85_9GAMM|nr:YqaJ viral recombinase family protein [Pseudoxanthomonas dokdonensis]KRG69147.1 hypothetical protein ABB29_12145 [Pseudoxanthomonas dokdonensis]
MITVELIQGSELWHAHRAQHFNASDAPAMMGCSPYKTRAQLLREVATGNVQEVDAATQRRFDDGHRYEALARPIAEQIIGEDLYPCVGVADHLPYSASFDGLTLLEDIAFEHKSLNDDLRLSMADGCTGADLPKHYRVQMEHQLLVSGAERVLFMASKWSGDELVEERHCWYVSDDALRAELLAGWLQFSDDLAAYEPEPAAAPTPAGRAPDQLPALHIEVTGMVTASNLREWRDAAIAVFQGINSDLQTDQDFADAEKTVKWCGDIEDQLKAAKQHALSQTASIDELFRTIDAISAEARTKRLELDKLVKSRKDERRTEIGNAGRRAVLEHVRVINESLGEHAITAPATLVADLGAAMKGKKSFASMQDAIDTVVANAKIESSQTADRVRANMALLEREGSEFASLFPDRVALCANKAPDDLRNLISTRVADHQAKLEAERERIRKEEADKLAKEQAAPVTPEPVAVKQPDPPAIPRRSESVPASVKVKLGDINARIAPLSISADGLAQLGFDPVATERGAKLYRESDMPAMLRAMTSLLSRAIPKAA